MDLYMRIRCIDGEIALVPAQLPNQAAGRFYHVQGIVGMGMDYECRPGYQLTPADPTRSQLISSKCQSPILQISNILPRTHRLLTTLVRLLSVTPTLRSETVPTRSLKF